MTQPDSTPHLLLIGGGHSHLLVLDELIRNPIPEVRKTLVVDSHLPVYSGMVPGLVAGQYTGDQASVDLRPLAQAAGVEIIEQAASHLETKHNTLILENGRSLVYTAASVNIGSTVAGLETPGVLEYALSTRPIAQLVARCQSLGKRERVLIVGGGAGGVELAFCLQSQLARIHPTVRVTLVTSSPTLLSPRRPRLARRVHSLAQSRGIGVRTETTITRVESRRAFTQGDEAIDFDLLVWASGAVGHPFFTRSGVPTEPRGFAWILNTLQLSETQNVFAAGDCATLRAYPKTPKAGVYAVRQGPLLSHNLRAFLAGNPLKEYRPQTDFLTLLNLGDGTAVGSRLGVTFKGHWVQSLKDRIDRRFVNRFRLN